MTDALPPTATDAAGLTPADPPKATEPPDAGRVAEVFRAVTVRDYRWVDFAGPVASAPPEAVAGLLARLHGLEWPAAMLDMPITLPRVERLLSKVSSSA